MSCCWLTNVLFGKLSTARQSFIECEFFPLAIHNRKMRQTEQGFKAGANKLAASDDCNVHKTSFSPAALDRGLQRGAKRVHSRRKISRAFNGVGRFLQRTRRKPVAVSLPFPWRMTYPVQVLWRVAQAAGARQFRLGLGVARGPRHRAGQARSSQC